MGRPMVFLSFFLFFFCNGDGGINLCLLLVSRIRARLSGGLQVERAKIGSGA